MVNGRVNKRKLLRSEDMLPICKADQIAIYANDAEIDGVLYDTCSGYSTKKEGLRAECKACKAYVGNTREGV